MNNCLHEKEYGQEHYARLRQLAAETTPADELSHFMEMGSWRPKELRKMKKFRFQLLHRWLVEHFAPCRVADIGGGKGLLAYLLQQSGWEAAVIDPIYQELPDKYKDIATGQRVKIGTHEKVRRVSRPFSAEMGREFDLLIGMHAHGCNALIVDAAAEYGCGYVLFPCCVIEEPFFPVRGVSWLESITAYGVEGQRPLHHFRLNFKGQNIGLCEVGERVSLSVSQSVS